MKNEWVLGRTEYAGVYLCRNILGTMGKKWEVAAQVIGFKDGEPDVWLKHYRILYSPITVIRDVPEEERVAILLRSIPKAPF